MTIVSDRFEGLPLQERREQIWEMLRQLNTPLSLDEEESFYSVAPIYTYGFGMKTDTDTER